MGLGLRADRRLQIAAVCQLTARWVVIVLLIAAAGCSKKGTQKSAAAQHGGDSSATASPGARNDAAPRAARHEASPAAANHVRLTQHGCIQFEPPWSDIHVGQTLVFFSDLKAPVTVHVASGAFEQAQFVVRPGASVSTGAARAAGSYSMWSEPAACQGAPLGARGTGPGVTVEATTPR